MQYKESLAFAGTDLQKEEEEIKNKEEKEISKK
jgi:hypothetical protein